MRKLREVLRLRFELHLGYQQIGRSCAIGVSTVCKYLKREEAAGVTWPLPEGWDDVRVESALFPAKASVPRWVTSVCANINLVRSYAPRKRKDIDNRFLYTCRKASGRDSNSVGQW